MTSERLTLRASRGYVCAKAMYVGGALGLGGGAIAVVNEAIVGIPSKCGDFSYEEM